MRLQRTLHGVLMSVDLVVTSQASFDKRCLLPGTLDYAAHREGGGCSMTPSDQAAQYLAYFSISCKAMAFLCLRDLTLWMPSHLSEPSSVTTTCPCIFEYVELAVG